jgi:hypothetical protein
MYAHGYIYRFKGKIEEGGATETTTRTKALLNGKSMKDFIVTHPQLTRIVLSIVISAAIGALIMVLTASPEQALAWRPTKGQPVVD